MNEILICLNKLDANYFPNKDRYYYLITNACTRTMFNSQDNATECKDEDISERSNITRIKKELKNHAIIILCGNKAHLLQHYLKNKIVITVPHLGNKGLNNTYPNRRLLQEKTSKDRHAKRYALVAKDIYDQLQNQIIRLTVIT